MTGNGCEERTRAGEGGKTTIKSKRERERKRDRGKEMVRGRRGHIVTRPREGGIDARVVTA